MNLYPAWIPYPRSWMKAFKTAIPTFYGGVIVALLEVWRFAFMGGGLVWFSPSSVPFFVGMMLLAVLLGFVVYLAELGIWSLLLRLLWSNPPKWLKVNTWRYILLGYLIAIMATMVAVPITFHILSIPLIFQNGTIAEKLQNTGRLPEILAKLAVPWLIVAAYLYQVEFLLHKRTPKESARSAMK